VQVNNNAKHLSTIFPLSIMISTFIRDLKNKKNKKIIHLEMPLLLK
jgi:hypothetical protein